MNFFCVCFFFILEYDSMCFETDFTQEKSHFHPTARIPNSSLGKPPFQKSAVFFNIVQKAFDPPPLLFEHLSYFAGGVFSCGEFFK